MTTHTITAAPGDTLTINIVAPPDPGPAPVPAPPPAPTEFVRGMDVSKWQRKSVGPGQWEMIDWKKVVADKAAIRFAFIKCSDVVIDPAFAAHWDGAGEVGLKRGGYMFFNPTRNVGDQVDLFIRTMQEFGVGELPPAVDVEYVTHFGVPDREAWTERLAFALERVEHGLGVKPLIYTSATMWWSRNPDALAMTTGPAWATAYPLWVAHYEVRQPTLPVHWTTWQCWQISSKGRVAGVPTNVDMDLWSGPLP